MKKFLLSARGDGFQRLHKTLRECRVATFEHVVDGMRAVAPPSTNVFAKRDLA